MAETKKKPSGGKKTSTAAKNNTKQKQSSTKSQTKQPQKSAPAQNRSASAQTDTRAPASQASLSLVVLLLAVAAIFSAVCLLVPDLTGVVGGGLHHILRGLFGGAAFFLPVLLGIGAIFYRRDAENEAVHLKLLFGFLLLALIGVLFHTAARENPALQAEDFFDAIAAMYSCGAEGIGGGVIGGMFAALLGLTGIVGTLVISILAILMLSLFYVSMTPYQLYLTIRYKSYRYRERRQAVREKHLPDMETRQAELKAREEAIAVMRAEQAERRRLEQEYRMRERAVSREEAILMGKRRRGAIDSNIYATDEDTTTSAQNPAAQNTAQQNGEEYTMPPEPPAKKPARKTPDRNGAPVSGEVYDRGQMRGEMPVSDNTDVSVTETETPAVPDEDAYTLAAEDERNALARGEESYDTSKFDRVSVIAAEPPAEKPILPTSELDLAAIFRNPDADAEAEKTEIAAEYDGYEEQTAELELTVTRSVPDGCAGADAEEEDDGIPPFDMDDAPVPNPRAAAAEEIPLGDPETDALIASLGAMYGTAKTEAAPPPVPQYQFPPLTLLKKDLSVRSEDVADELESNAAKLVGILRSFNVKTKIINVSRGPTITRYELQPEAGTRVRSVANLVDDIALGLAADGVRIEAPIPGKSAIGIEVPNHSVSTVYIRDLIDSESFRTSKSKLTTCLGMDVAGAPIYLDAAKMPHLLICGATGMGKSVCINSLIVSMLYKATPDEVKLILIDPKKVELNIYSGIPHLLVPVVSDPKKAAGALHWAVTEMERRFALIEDVGMRDIKGYNEITKNDPDREYLPQIVIIIDELADLMMTAPDDVEESICRLAQKARAAGMHLIIGTQRPSVDVITGLIKANIPSRIAFRVSSQMDSRVVLDTVGAEKLIGRGDMLYAPVGAPKPQRVQGAFVSEEEIDGIITFIKKNAGHAAYSDDVMESIEKEAAMCGQKKGKAPMEGDDFDGDGSPDDPMLRNAVELAVETGKISTSLIQRRLSLGYGRAAKLIDRMEQMGYVSAPEGQKPRRVLITKEQYMELVLKQEDII